MKWEAGEDLDRSERVFRRVSRRMTHLNRPMGGCLKPRPTEDNGRTSVHACAKIALGAIVERHHRELEGGLVISFSVDAVHCAAKDRPIRVAYTPNVADESHTEIDMTGITTSMQQKISERVIEGDSMRIEWPAAQLQG